MIKVLFFAKLREQLKTGQLDIEYNESIQSVNDLLEVIASSEGELFKEKLLSPQIITAVNHEVSDRDSTVKDGDEVAFYPPVSGG